MLSPTVASYINQFYPLGNTPAVSLTRCLPQGIDASILLLGCGDVRNILYTAYMEAGMPPRNLDITCCDYDESILARNVLLFSLIIDEEKTSKDTLWNIYYHLYLSASDLAVVSAQVKKLLAVSNSLQNWRSSPYGNILHFCDKDTLDDVQAVWTKYEKEPVTDSAFQSKLKQVRQNRERTLGKGAFVNMTGFRSAAPLALQASVELSDEFSHFWDRGNTSGPRSGNNPNPLFAATLSDHKALHYGTDPVLGFHLAAGYAPLTSLSPLRPGPEVANEKFKGVAAAKTQFQEWVGCFRRMVEDKIVAIRVVAADALACCHVLQNCAAHGQNAAGWYRRQFDSRVMELDAEEYSSSGSAPTVFDVIDTSNLADHLGALNILVAALPLLVPKPWATLFTETLIKREGTARKAFDKLLCGHAPTVTLLLGVSPVEYWANATTTSSVDEVLLQFTANESNGTASPGQVHSRLSWKLTEQFSGQSSKVTPFKLTSEAAARLIFAMYLQMFDNENLTAMAAASESDQLRMMQNTAYSHFHRGSLVALLKFMKARLNLVAGSWDDICKLLVHMSSTDRTLMLAGNHMQAFCVQMHMQGIYTEPSLKNEIQQIPSLGSFYAWKSLPAAVCVTLVVPRAQLNRLFSGSPTNRVAAPTVHGSLKSSSRAAIGWHNMFSDVHLSFGTIAPMGSRSSDEYHLSINEDKSGWSGKSTLIASFYAPAAALQVEPKKALVSLDVQGSAQSIRVFGSILGESMSIYETTLDDKTHVFITKYMPGQTRLPAVSEKAPAVNDGGGEENGPTSSSLTADVNLPSGALVTSITGRLDVKSADGKALLADKATTVELSQRSPFVIDVVFGNNTLVYPLHFPVPVNTNASKTRIARKSSYVEVIVPFDDPATSSSLADFVSPSTLVTTPTTKIPATLNTAHLNVVKLPIVDLKDKSAIRWLTTLASFQFSVSEKRQREQTDSATGLANSPRVNFKESLFTMFMLSAGLQGGQTGLFAINHPERGGIHMLLFVSALRLDGAAGSVVLDAAVLPFTTRLIESGALEAFLLHIRSLEICSMNVNDEELILWKKTLPSMAERCRTWSHTSKCEYTSSGAIPLSLEPSKPVLCTCGTGKLPPNFIAVPEWDNAAQYATRIAISPVYAVPFVEDVVDMNAMSGPQGPIVQGERCNNCGKSEKDATLKKCARCLKVRYCSAECQKKDWRKHRGEC